MAKRTVNFRFSEETLQILDVLSEQWDCTRTKVIERALRSSVHTMDHPHSAVAMVEGRGMPEVQPSSAHQLAEKAARGPQGRTLTGHPHGPVPKGKK